MKLPNYIRNNFWFINFKVINLLIFLICFILFCANFVLNLIEFLTSKF